MDNSLELMNNMQNYRFAAYDMLLFLDTHPEDKKAFEIFKDLSQKYMNLRAEYEKSYGPLSPLSTASQDSFNWLDSAWPWEKEAN